MKYVRLAVAALLVIVAVVCVESLRSPAVAQARDQVECIQIIGDGDLSTKHLTISYDDTNEALYIDHDDASVSFDCAYDNSTDILLNSATIANSCSTDNAVIYFDTGTSRQTCEANFLYNPSTNALTLVGSSDLGVNVSTPDHDLDVYGETELIADNDDVVLQVKSCADPGDCTSPTSPQLRLSNNSGAGQDCDFTVDASRNLDIDCGGSGTVTFQDAVAGIACSGQGYVQYGETGAANETFDCTIKNRYNETDFEHIWGNNEGDREFRIYADDNAAEVPADSIMLVAEDTDLNNSLTKFIIAVDNEFILQTCCTSGAQCEYPVDACPLSEFDRIKMVAGELYVCASNGVIDGAGCTKFTPNLTINSGSAATSTGFVFNTNIARTTGLMAEFEDAGTPMWTLDTSPMRVTLGDGTDEDIAYYFDLAGADQSITWDDAAGPGDGFLASDPWINLDGGVQDDPFWVVWDRNSAFNNEMAKIQWLESSNTFHVYGLDIVEIGTEDPSVPASANNPYIQISRTADQISLIGATVIDVSQSTVLKVSDEDALTVGTGGQGTGSLSKQLTRITTGSDGNDVTINNAGDGRFWFVANESGADLDYYPVASSEVNNAGTNNPITLGGNNLMVCINSSNGQESHCGQLGLDTEPPKKTFLFSSFIEENDQNLDHQMWGGFVSLNTAETINSGASISVTNGVSKLLVVLNTCSDSAGSITVTGDSYNRDTGAVSSADTDTLTISGLTTDSSSTDAQSNTIHAFSNAYITAKWFTDVTLSTADINCTDVDVYGVMFEQANDNDNATLATIDISAIPTHTNAWFYAYVYLLTVSGDTATIAEQVSAASCQPLEVTTAESEPDVPYRLRCVMDADFDGSTDGFWVEMHPGPSALSYWTNVATKLWVEADQ